MLYRGYSGEGKKRRSSKERTDKGNHDAMDEDLERMVHEKRDGEQGKLGTARVDDGQDRHA